MTVDAVIDNVLREAARHDGAHYVHGAGGSMPGGHDGCFGRRSAVQMFPDDPDFPSGHARHRTDADRTVAIMKAAYTDLHDGKWVCAGRNWIHSHPPVCRTWQEVYTNPGIAAHYSSPADQGFLWPRPSPTLNGTEAAWGEPCAGIRHFDCIMYIRYIVERAAPHIPQSAIPSTIHGWGSHSHRVASPPLPVRAGDILIEEAGGHIAIAASATLQWNAESTNWGVRSGRIPASARVVRMSDDWWLGRASGH